MSAVVDRQLVCLDCAAAGGPCQACGFAEEADHRRRLMLARVAARRAALNAARRRHYWQVEKVDADRMEANRKAARESQRRRKEQSKMNTPKQTNDRSRCTEEKFWKYVWKRPDGCWTWAGGRISSTGSGRGGMQWNGERLSARRIAWAIARGDIAEHRLIPICGRAGCINPDHLKEALGGDRRAAIFADRQPGETITALAKRHGCSREGLSRYLSAKNRGTRSRRAV